MNDHANPPRAASPTAPGPNGWGQVAMQWLSPHDAIAFVDWDVTTDQLTWDVGAEERLGVPPGSMTTFDEWAAFVHPEDLADVIETATAAIARRDDRVVYRYRLRRLDGEVRLMEVVSLHWYDDDQLLRTRGAVIDVTRSEAVRRDLARSEAQLRTIIETVPDAILMIDHDGTIHSFNAPAERMFGYAASETVGRNVKELMPDDVARAHDQSFARYLADGRSGRAARNSTARRKDGSEFPIELIVGEAEWDGEPFFMCFVRDITERIDDAERQEAMRAQYLRTARLNVMGIVAAGLAHELNQPLAASANYLAASKLLLEDGKPADDVAATLDQAQRQIDLAAEIIRRLRGFLSRGSASAQQLALPEIVAEATALALVGRDRSRTTVSCAASTPVLMADRVQVLQVLVNLIRNAANAMGRAHRGKIFVDAVPLDDGILAVSVTDNGPGFQSDPLAPMSNLVVDARATDGMGLGLTICSRIVQSWNGRLVCDNAPGGGGRVTFTVPAASGPA